MKARTAFGAALAILALVWAVALGLARVADARAAYRRAAAAAGSKAPAPAPGVAIVAADARSARARLGEGLADQASAAGLRLALAAQPDATPDIIPGRIAARVGGAASEAVLRAFVRTVEAGRPTVRFTRWSIRRQGRTLRFDADAVAFWTAAAGPSPGRVAPPDPVDPGEQPALFASDGDGPEAPKPAGAPPELIGIVGRLAVDPRAIVRLGDGSTRTLLPGQAAGAWRLVAIGADRARFVHDGRERTMVLPTSVPPDRAAAADQ